MNNDTKTKKLLDLVHDQIQLRHYSHRTEESYIHSFLFSYDIILKPFFVISRLRGTKYL